MTAKELRRAAILLHDWCFDSTIKYQDCEHPWDAHLNDFDVDDAILKALEPVLAHILATVQEDGEEIPDENYLSKEWPRLGGSFDDSEAGYLHLEHDSLLGSLYFYLGKLRYAISVGNSIPITTRSQFRSLMTGLNIEPLSKLVKPLDEE